MAGKRFFFFFNFYKVTSIVYLIELKDAISIEWNIKIATLPKKCSKEGINTRVLTQKKARMDKVDEFLNELVFVTFIANKFLIQFCCM